MEAGGEKKKNPPGCELTAAIPVCILQSIPFVSAPPHWKQITKKNKKQTTPEKNTSNNKTLCVIGSVWKFSVLWPNSSHWEKKEKKKAVF